MSRRQRVPKRKQLTNKHRSRNANPKLSPYQKEQKRERMANQPPVNKLKRDFPASARRIHAFLDAKSKRGGGGAKGRASSTDDEAVEFVPTVKEEQHASSSPPTSAVKAAKSSSIRKSGTTVKSLNSQITEGHEEDNALLKRLEKKHQASEKKRELRRGQRIDKLKAQSDAVDAVVRTAGKKGKRSAADEEEVAGKMALALDARRSTRRKKSKYPAANDAEQQDEAGDGTDSAVAAKRPTAVSEPVAPQPVHPAPERDFDDLIDVIRFGERADAPPTFDRLPKRDATLLPSQHIGKAKRQQLIDEERREKIQRIVSGNAAPLQLKLVSTQLPDGSELVAPSVKNARLETADDFAALRARVMARYAQKNKGTFNQRRRDVQFTIGGEAM